MKKVIITISALLILVTVTIFALVKFSEMSAWQLISKTKSPNSKFEVRVFRYISDLDRHAPYGYYVTIQPQRFNADGKRGHVAFAGYCKNEASIHWLSNESLDIICQIENEKDIRTLSTKTFGIDIQIRSKQYFPN